MKIPMPLSPPEPPDRSAEDAVAQAQALLERGEPLLAYNRVQAGLAIAPVHVRLRQLQALALARSGDTEGANALLLKLAEAGLGDAETLGMLARTHKDLGLQAADPSERARHLDAGLRLYTRAFESSRAGDPAGAYYAGINAATLAVLTGDLARGRQIAAEVVEICRGASRADTASSRYWLEATLGEAALILGDAAAAATHYTQAAQLGASRYGDLGSTRRQARLLAAHLPGLDIDPAACLAIPPVLVMTGHMIDQAGRETPRFPPALEPALREALRQRLVALAPLAAYGSAACGTDLICLELMRDLGAETHVVLPFPPDEFRAASVDFAQGDWGARFDRALAAADSVTVASDHRASGSAASFEYANLILTGMGRLRARMLDTKLSALAAWDPGAIGAAGGAASLVSLWEEHGVAVEHLHLAPLRGEVTRAGKPTAPDAPAAPAVHEIRSLLVADVAGYSQLHEDQIPRFISEFLGAVAELNRRTAHRHEHVETSGDGLYMVFGSARDAGHYALELSALVNDTDWGARGLPPTFNLRIALHCGPVHRGRDPITGSPLYTGPHASRAARIEPITPPGQVYASQAFAAVAAASGAEGLDLRYVGRVALAKGYGTLAMYHVCPSYRSTLQ